MTRAELNAELVRLLRAAMGFYARRWRVLHTQSQERDRACDLLSQAVRLRELAKRWQQHPV